MGTLLADSPPPAQPDANGQSYERPGQGPEQAARATAPAAGGHPCPKCGAAMAPGQDWCLHCGAGAPGSLGGGGWRPAAAVLGATALLLLAAAGAGYAALSHERATPGVVTRTVAAATVAPAATTPGTPPSTPATPATPAKPPAIALKAVTPAPAAAAPATTAPSTAAKPAEKAAKPAEKAAGTGQGTSTTGAAEKAEASKPEPILLDTNAASTYNPYGYPAAGFGDPSLAIDGDTSTGWTAQVDPTTAPKMAVGLLIDLRSPQQVSYVQLVTSTPGMTVQIYGANVQTVPASITEKEWVPLSPATVVRKRHTKIALKDQKSSFTFLTLWISKAPASSVGTPTAPGRVTVNELELFPAS